MASTYPTPNYVNPESRGNELIIISTVLLFIGAVAVVLRFWAHVASRIWAVDDIFIALAWLCALGLDTVLNISSSKYGWNRHIWDIPYQWIPMAAKMGYVSKICYLLGLMFTRLSILMFYYRLVAGTTWTRGYRIVLHIAVFFVVTFGLVFLGLTIFQCDPIHIYWSLTRDGRCRREGLELFISTTISCILDAMLVALPIPVIWRLQLPIRKRLEAIALLSVGLLATIAGILRAYYTHAISSDNGDNSWLAFPAYVASDVEINLGIICACAPHIRPLAKRFIKYLKRTFDIKTTTKEEPASVTKYPVTGQAPSLQPQNDIPSSNVQAGSPFLHDVGNALDKNKLAV